MATRGRPLMFHHVKDQILTAMRGGAGMRRAAEISGVSSAALTRWVSVGERDPDSEFADFAIEVRRIQASMIIEAEHSLRKHVQEGNLAAVTWYLERRCPEDYARRDAPPAASGHDVPDATDDEVAEALGK